MTGKLDMLIDAGFADFALRLTRNCVQDQDCPNSTIASTMGLCAALCGGNGTNNPATKRAMNIFLSGDAPQVINQALQRVGTGDGGNDAELLASCSDFTTRLMECVVQEDGALEGVSQRMETMSGLVKRIVTLAGSNPNLSSNSTCMESVLNMVVTGCSGTNDTNEGSKTFSQNLMSSLLESDVKNVLVSAMSSVGVSEAVLRAGRRATILIDRATMSSLQSGGGGGDDGSGSGDGGKIQEEPEGLAEAVLRCVGAVVPGSAPAVLVELAGSLRMLSASLAGEETLDKGCSK